jgi:hypothetical protein
MVTENEKMRGTKRRNNQFLYIDFSGENSKEAGSGFGFRDEQYGSYFLELRKHFFGLKYLNSLMRSGSGMEKVGSWIRDKHPGSATLKRKIRQTNNIP